MDEHEKYNEEEAIIAEQAEYIEALEVEIEDLEAALESYIKEVAELKQRISNIVLNQRDVISKYGTYEEDW